MLRALRCILALILVLGLIWILSTSSSFQDCIAGQNEAHSQENRKHPPKLFFTITNQAATCIKCAGHLAYEYRDAVTAAATVLIAAFTYTLFAATKGLVEAAKIQSSDMKRSIVASEIAANAAQKSADIAEKAFFATHRPIITIGDLELVESDDVTDKPHINWGLRNSGSGFAVVTKIKVETVIQGDGTARIYSRESSAWVGTIEPGMTSSGHQVTTATMQVRIKDILAGRLLLYFNIELQLMDIMETRSSARFPFIFDSQVNSFRRTDPLVIGDEKDDSQA
jgi:hypothetical protein